MPQAPAAWSCVDSGMARALLVCLLLAGCMAAEPAGSRGETSSGTRPSLPPLDDLDRLVHDEANRARTRRSVQPVAWSDTLAAIARGHSRDMARRNYFAHVSPDGETTYDRGVAGGVECRKRVTVGVSENLYRTTRYERVRGQRMGTAVAVTADWFTALEIARAAVDGWLDSPGHRRNLLDPTFDAEGVGVALGPGDLVYITQVFC